MIVVSVRAPIKEENCMGIISAEWKRTKNAKKKKKSENLKWKNKFFAISEKLQDFIRRMFWMEQE